MKEIKEKWFKKCLVLLIRVLFFIMALVFVVDPYFHYHKPFSFISYRLYYERYANDGINRHFDYDAIVTGTSMAQNFKTSELDDLFGTKSIKQTFSGAGYAEISQNLERALKRNENLKTVIWTVDYNGLLRDKDWTQYEGYPTYLYDDNLFNDVSYIFNKSILYQGVLPNILMTLTGQESTTMDEYSSWAQKESGYEYVMANYDRWSEKAEMSSDFSAQMSEMVYSNIKENIVNLVNQYPDTQFYLFYTPYSICYWDFLNQEGMMLWQFEAEKIATELLLDCPNVHLYSFTQKHDIINDLSNYRDKEHYSAQVSTEILKWILKGEGLITKSNYMERLSEEKEYYLNYDYESIFQDDVNSKN